jgi:hypothetical protein
MGLLSAVMVTGDGPCHKEHIFYRLFHSVCALVGIGTCPLPFPQASVPPEQKGGGGGVHSPAGEGVGESNSDDWKKMLSTLPILWSKRQKIFFCDIVYLWHGANSTVSIPSIHYIYQ